MATAVETLKPPSSHSLHRQQSFASSTSSSSCTASGSCVGSASGDVNSFLDYDGDQSTVATTFASISTGGDSSVADTPEPRIGYHLDVFAEEFSDTHTTPCTSSFSSSSSAGSSTSSAEDNTPWCYVLPEVASDVSKRLSTIKTVTFDFNLRVDRIRVSWKDPDYHRTDQYQIRAYLLLNEHEEEQDCVLQSPDGDSVTDSPPIDSKKCADKISNAKPKQLRRKQDQKQLIAKPLVANRSLTLSTSGVTEICFDDQEIRFRARIPVLKNMHKKDGHEHESFQDRPDYVFQSRVVRLKLERVKQHSSLPSAHPDRVIIGFIDLDLAQLRHQHARDPGPRSDGFMDIPMVLFTDYNRKHILKHERSKLDSPLFCFDIRLRLDSNPIPVQGDPLLLPLDIWVSAESLFSGSDQNGSSLNTNCSSQSLHLSQLLLRRDSLPNLSKDKELKYHECPPISRTKHLLNLFGILPPGQLFRVSIHFGALEQLDHLSDLNGSCHQMSSGCVPKKIAEQTKSSICACFEVKHYAHQPTIFHHHHQRHSICCRTKQLVPSQISAKETRDQSSPLVQFDQHFTFFERFYYSDSPVTCLSIMNAAGKKLYKFKCHLADYVHCRSVNQYFPLQGKKSNQFCRLQFSIVVKPVGSEGCDGQ